MPSGNYVIIKGNSADANADFLRSGYEDVIGDAVTAGDIKIVGETYTDNWDAANAQTEMEQFLTAANNDVQAVLSENDGMAGGVVAALDAQGLAGQVPVSGQDGDLPALNRVALGTQTVDVWKDARLLGKAAGEAAIQLCANPTSAPWRAPPRSRRRAVTTSRRSCSPRSRSPGTTSTSSSMPAGSTRRRCARACQPGRCPSADATADRLQPLAAAAAPSPQPRAADDPSPMSCPAPSPAQDTRARRRHHDC